MAIGGVPWACIRLLHVGPLPAASLGHEQALPGRVEALCLFTFEIRGNHHRNQKGKRNRKCQAVVGPLVWSSQQGDPSGSSRSAWERCEGGCCGAEKADETEPIQPRVLVLFLSWLLFAPDSFSFRKRG